MRTSDPARGQAILETAAQLFASRRYHEVRMEDVALKAGVAKGTIYRYFQDKEDLYLALIVAGSERLLEEVQAGIAQTEDPREKLLVYVRSSIRFFLRFPYFIDLVQRLESSDAKDKIATLQGVRQRFFRLVAGLLQELGAGRDDESEPHRAALALTGMIRQILRFLPQPWPADLAEWIVNQFLSGLTGFQRERKRSRGLRSYPRRRARLALS